MSYPVQIKRQVGRPSHITKFLEVWGVAYVHDLQRQQVGSGQVATGASLRQWFIRIFRPDELEIFNTSGYIKFLAPPGRGPTRSGVQEVQTLREKILDWIRVKGIMAVGISEKSLAFLIARKIHNEGTWLHRKGMTHSGVPGLDSEFAIEASFKKAKPDLNRITEDLVNETMKALLKPFSREPNTIIQ